MSGSNYSQYVYRFENEVNRVNPDAIHEGRPPEDEDDLETDYILKPQAYFRGKSQIPGAKYNVGFQFFVKPVFLEQQSHYHDVDEYLFFLGVYPNLFDFDAKIEFHMGEEQEKIIISEPTVIRVPAGTVHCPLNFLRVEKPVFFQAALMQGTFGSIMSGKNFWYDGPNRRCCYDHQKKCTYCYKCVGDTSVPDALGI